MQVVLGWDIGGVNTKAALVMDGRLLGADVRPFELQHAPMALASVLRGLAASLLRAHGMAGPSVGSSRDIVHAVTMTAELSQLFRSKREGVTFVLDVVVRAFPDAAVAVYTTDGTFLPVPDAREAWRSVAAANWAATARLVARQHPDAILIDTGTTTTDVIPIAAGEVVAHGWTDPDRLACGELVYTGVVRTPTEALTNHIWVKGQRYGVSAEGFALAADVHVWRGDLSPGDYTVPTPDGRPAARPFAGERLRRVICADPALVDDSFVDDIANSLAGAQVARVADAVIRVRTAHPTVTTAVVTGLGAFLAEAAARTAGLTVLRLTDDLGTDAARFAAAAAVAVLWADRPRTGIADFAGPQPTVDAPPVVDIVVKVGGSLMAHPSHLDIVMSLLREAAHDQRIVVVPGGGAFADVVRRVDGALHLSASAAHWAAVRAMDQFAEVLADRFPHAVVVTDPAAIAQTVRYGRVGIVAPHTWLRAEDPLPHSWDVTADSIAAWVAGALSARRVVLVKAPGAKGTLVDSQFERVLPGDVEQIVVTADDALRLRGALNRQ